MACHRKGYPEGQIIFCSRKNDLDKIIYPLSFIPVATASLRHLSPNVGFASLMPFLSCLIKKA